MGFCIDIEDRCGDVVGFRGRRLRDGLMSGGSGTEEAGIGAAAWKGIGRCSARNGFWRRAERLVER